MGGDAAFGGDPAGVDTKIDAKTIRLWLIKGFELLEFLARRVRKPAPQ
jgi:hypothetical protein